MTEAGSRESRFATKRGTLVWTEMPDRIRVEDRPKLRWRHRCVLAAVLLTDAVLWGWIVLAVGHALHCW